MEKAGYVYIMASGENGTIYIGVTSDLVKRVWEHREGVIRGFTKKYGCKRLVWFEASMTFSKRVSESCKGRSGGAGGRSDSSRDRILIGLISIPACLTRLSPRLGPGLRRGTK